MRIESKEYYGAAVEKVAVGVRANADPKDPRIVFTVSVDTSNQRTSTELLLTPGDVADLVEVVNLHRRDMKRFEKEIV